MTSLPSNIQAILPDPLERRQIFNCLQRFSSLTAWRRILSFYEAWAQATEDSLRVADDRGWADKTALPHAEYALILTRLAPAARAAYLPSRAREVIEFLNRVGVNNAEQWLPNEIRPA